MFTNYQGYGSLDQDFQYDKNNFDDLKNTQSLNFKDEQDEDQELGKIVTVRNFVRQNSEESLSGPMPTPNIPESPDSTNQIGEPSYRNNLELGPADADILNFDELEHKMLMEKQKERQKEMDKIQKKQELREYLEMVKESVEQIYNQKFRNVKSNYEMKEEMHLKVIRELKKKADTLIRQASDRSILTQNDLKNTNYREITDLKSQAQRKDKKISKLSQRIIQLESELVKHTPQEPEQKISKIYHENKKEKDDQIEELQRKIEDLEEQNGMLLFRIKEHSESQKALSQQPELSKDQIEQFLEFREQELKEKYKSLEDHLTNKFKVETGLFFENIQKEMEEILASKGLPASKRLQIEQEVREEYRSQYRTETSQNFSKSPNSKFLTPIDIGINATFENGQIDTQRKISNSNQGSDKKSDKSFQANMVSFGLFASQTSKQATGEISDPDEL